MKIHKSFPLKIVRVILLSVLVAFLLIVNHKRHQISIRIILTLLLQKENLCQKWQVG